MPEQQPNFSLDSGLYKFLMKLQEHKDILLQAYKSPLDAADFQWLERYLQSPDIELYLRAIDTGGRTPQGEIIYQKDYQFAGEHILIYDVLADFLTLRPDFIHPFSAAVDAALDNQISNMTTQKLHDETAEQPKAGSESAPENGTPGH